MAEEDKEDFNGSNDYLARKEKREKESQFEAHFI